MSPTLLETAATIAWPDVRDYLQSRGWTASASRRDYVMVFRNGGALELHLPLDRALQDYAEGMEVLARRLAEYEHRSPSAVIHDLRQPRVDTLRFALEGEAAATGAIGLFDGADLVMGVKQALLASACSTERPGKMFYPRMSLGEADAFVHACKLGQTEIGSFVLTVEAPLETTPQLPTQNEEPFGRRTTRYLLEALTRLRRAVETRATYEILAPQMGVPIVSANLCESLITMAPKDESCDVRIRAAFSPILRSSANPPPTSVYFDRAVFPLIEELGRQLRPRQGPEPALFFGYVTGLHGEPDENGRLAGTVEISSLHGEELLTGLQFDLGPDDYASAIEAHKNQRTISVRGVLHRRARSKRLEQIVGFELLSEL